MAVYYATTQSGISKHWPVCTEARCKTALKGAIKRHLKLIGKYIGKRPVGDVELVDEIRRAYLGFLNKWHTSGSKDRTRLGQLIC